MVPGAALDAPVVSPLPVPPGFSALEPFDAGAHQGLGIRREVADRFGAGQNACYLAATEFFRALHHYPIVFSRLGDGDDYVPVAVFGLRDGENLFVDQAGAWEEGAYRPAYVRAYPFYTLDLPPAAAGAEPRSLVCVDPTGLGPTESPLVTRDGRPTALWQDRLNFLRELDTARRQTRNLTESLTEFGLLELFEAHAHGTGGDIQRLGGLYRVNEGRLNSLAPEALATLMARGLMSRIYGHLISLDNFAGLLDRGARREKQG